MPDLGWVITRIIGDGSEQNSFRPDLDGFSFSAVIPSKPDGKPVYPFALCLVEATDAQAAALNASTAVAWKNLDAPVVKAVRDKLRVAGLTEVPSVMPSDPTARDVLAVIRNRFGLDLTRQRQMRIRGQTGPE